MNMRSCPREELQVTALIVAEEREAMSNRKDIKWSAGGKYATLF
jgi:hypothetical protein